MTQSRSGSSIWFILMKQSIRGSPRIGRSSQECCGNISRVHFKTMINRLALRRIQCLIGTGFRVDPSSATPCGHTGDGVLRTVGEVNGSHDLTLRHSHTSDTQWRSETAKALHLAPQTSQPKRTRLDGQSSCSSKKSGFANLLEPQRRHA